MAPWKCKPSVFPQNTEHTLKRAQAGVPIVCHVALCRQLQIEDNLASKSLEIPNSCLQAWTPFIAIFVDPTAKSPSPGGYLMTSEVYLLIPPLTVASAPIRFL